jgi:hypothetical protein
MMGAAILVFVFVVPSFFFVIAGYIRRGFFLICEDGTPHLKFGVFSPSQEEDGAFELSFGGRCLWSGWGHCYLKGCKFSVFFFFFFFVFKVLKENSCKR